MKIKPGRLLTICALSIQLIACGGGDSVTTAPEDTDNTTATPVTNTPPSKSGSSYVVALPDGVTTYENTEITIHVVDNDTVTNDSIETVKIISSSMNGSLTVNNDLTVSYNPTSGYLGLDKFRYQITTSSGKTSDAEASILVQCNLDCSYTLTVSWDANLESDIAGYFVYMGPSIGNYTGRIWVNNSTLQDFSLQQDGTHYFAVSAVNDEGGESELSTEVNITIVI